MSDNDVSSTEKEKTTIKPGATSSTEEVPPEVFDSSTYDSMTDLKTSASMKESEVNKVLSYTEGKEPIEPEAVHTESTKNVNISPTVAPTMEGRASTLKKSKKVKLNLYQSSWKNKLSKSIKK
jgi:hypothetical protein